VALDAIAFRPRVLREVAGSHPDLAFVLPQGRKDVNINAS
jgi:hypothetical protein